MLARTMRTSSSIKKPMCARWAPEHGFNYTALRPQLVTGATPGALNVLPAIGVYAAIRREKGEPFGFPGGPSFVWEAADADLVADVMVWAAQSPQAANEAFNITNGDVFEWRNVWPAMAKILGVETGPDMPTSVAAYLKENADLWDRIVTKYGTSFAEPAGACRPRRSACGLRIRLRRPGRTSGIREHRQAAPGRVHKDNRYRGRLPQCATVPARSQTPAARHKIIGPGYARSFWVT